MSLSRIFYGHMICLLKLLCYLYLDPIVCLDVVDQMFKCTGNYFLLGALITPCLYCRCKNIKESLGYTQEDV